VPGKVSGKDELLNPPRTFPNASPMQVFGPCDEALPPVAPVLHLDANALFGRGSCRNAAEILQILLSCQHS
jgi:hypothetical protein